jgi:hypothetical protein
MSIFADLFSRFRANNSGQFRFNLNAVNASTQFHQYGKEKEKLAAVLSNPALAKVISLQCDLFSLGEIFVYDKEGAIIDNDPFENFIRNPNPFQSRSQFLWDFMFWNMLGNSYTYVDSKVVDKRGNFAYFLDPAKIEWPTNLDIERDVMLFSPESIRARGKEKIVYRYDSGQIQKIELDRIIISHDLTNGVGNWYKGPSRIDALHKVISNSEHALDAKNINVRYSGKFLVGSDSDINKVPLTDTEKEDIRTKMDSDQNVWPLKSMIQIRRFVENMKVLELGSAFLEDYFLIGTMYGIPRDVLEAYNSSTYENQEKARAAHVSYTLQPKGNDYMNLFERHFGYHEQGKNIVIDWAHLPFMTVFEKERADMDKVKMETMKLILDMGYSREEAAKYLDIEL